MAVDFCSSKDFYQRQGEEAGEGEVHGNEVSEEGGFGGGLEDIGGTDGEEAGGASSDEGADSDEEEDDDDDNGGGDDDEVEEDVYADGVLDYGDGEGGDATEGEATEDEDEAYLAMHSAEAAMGKAQAKKAAADYEDAKAGCTLFLRYVVNVIVNVTVIVTLPKQDGRFRFFTVCECDCN